MRWPSSAYLPVIPRAISKPSRFSIANLPKLLSRGRRVKRTHCLQRCRVSPPVCGACDSSSVRLRVTVSKAGWSSERVDAVTALSASSVEPPVQRRVRASDEASGRAGEPRAIELYQARGEGKEGADLRGISEGCCQSVCRSRLQATRATRDGHH